MYIILEKTYPLFLFTWHKHDVEHIEKAEKRSPQTLLMLSNRAQMKSELPGGISLEPLNVVCI